MLIPTALFFQKIYFDIHTWGEDYLGAEIKIKAPF